jgi:hypothetical protein
MIDEKVPVAKDIEKAPKIIRMMIKMVSELLLGVGWMSP